MRFIGGGIAPYVAGKLADAAGLSLPFSVGAASFVLAIPVLATGHKMLAGAEAHLGEAGPVTARLTAVGDPAPAGTAPVVVAVGSHGRAQAIVEAAARLASATGSPLEIVHVQQTAVVEEQATETETTDQARAAVTAHLERAAAHGLTVSGQILSSVGDHAAAGRALAHHADEVGARAVAVGRSPRGALAQFADGSFTSALTHEASCDVVLVETEGEPRRLTRNALKELRGSAV
ncbi:universal stress protein [Streptomyces sp. VRA16 Mangrove soil]|nr:universal stress protein [Streptomyces sp. VRA16 Mangrove soil]